MRNPKNQRRVIDLPPPPPLMRHHHHHLRYGNVLYPPDFFHPTLPPHAGQSLIVLQPPTSRSSHIAHPPVLPRFICAPLRHPPLDRSHLYEIGLPPKPYLHRKIFPPPPPPPPASTRENVHLRPSHWSGELYNKRDDVKRCGNGMNDDRDCGEKRWDNEKMDYDEMRQDSINGWIRGLYKNRDDDERRRGSGISDHGLYCEGGNDERRLNHGTNDAVLLGLGNRRPELMENASSLSRCSGRLRSAVSEGEPVRSKKKRRLQKKKAIYRIESGKDCSKNKGGHNCQRLTKELSGCSLKGKENEGFECLQTRMGSKREKKSQEHAIPFKRSNALVAEDLLAPLCPDIKTDIDKRIVKTGTRFSMPGLPMARSSEDVVKTDLLACGLDLRYDSLGTSKELLDKAVVSKSGSVADDANDLGEIAVRNQLQKDMNLEGPTFESGSTRRNRLRRKRKAEKMRLHKISVQMREDIGDITNASDCITTSASPRPRSEANDFGEIAVENQPQKDMSSQGLTVGPGSTRRKKRKARKKLLHETSTEIRKDSGHIMNANDYIIPLASPQPCSNANNLCEIDINNLQKDMSLEGPTAVGSVSTRRKKRKGRKKLLHETSMPRRENSGCIINAIDCIIPSASLRPCSDTALPKRNLSDAFTRLVPEAVLLPAFGGIVTKEAYSNCDSCNSFVPYLKRKRSSLTTLSASHYVSDSVVSESSGHAEKLVTSSEDAEVERDAHERFLANESTGHGDSLGFNQHDNNADKVVLNEVSVSAIEKSRIEPVDQYAKLGTDRVDDISEHPFHAPSLENSFVNGASKVMVSLEDNDIAGSLQVDRCTSEVHPSNTSSKSVNALPLKPENAIISEADQNSEDAFLNKLNATLVVVDSEEFRILEGVAISNDSNVISTSTDFLEADQKGIIFDSLSPNSLSNKPFVDDIGSIEGPLEAISNTKTCLSVDCLSNITGKRKDRGAQTGLFGTSAALGTSITDEVGRLLAKDLVPAMKIDFPGEEGSSKEVDKSNEGPSRVEYPTTELDFDANHPFPSFSKKRKVASPRSNLSSSLEDEMVADGLNSNCSRLYQGSTGLTESESGERDDIIFSRNTEPSACQSENEIISGGENISNKKPVSLSPDLNLFPSVKSLEKAVSVNSQINAELSRSLPEAKSEVAKKWNPVHGNQTLRRNQWASASPKVFPGRHPLYISNSRNLQSTHVAKSRTWHRNGSSSVAAPEIKLQPSPPVQCHETKMVRSVQSSYTRKGNSLVRNPSPSGSTIGFQNSSCSFFRLTSLTDNLKNKQESDSQTGDTEAQSIRRTEQIKVSEMPCKTIDAGEERIKSPGVPECWADSNNSSNHQCTLEEGNPEKKITYVRRRSNQLIAASNSDDMSILGRDKIQASSSDGYYKRKKNQLVRGPSENHVEERNANGNSRRLVSRTSPPRTYTRRPYGIAKHSKFSLVWKLHEIHSSEKDKTAMGPQKVLPHLCSWKRSTHWRTFMHALSTKPKKSSFASQTLMLSRKRGAVYTRSTRGYSLRMSKVLSVGGSSLKWSKSIERNSKKANEEVTRAVAAAEKRKKENGALPIASKSRNNVSRKLVISVQLRPGERIFRIGSERYKMDPTRRTLHRIIAEKETSSSVVLQTEKNVRRSYVPRRLLIGNEEYVRIGNGNQLVRDPKKRTRVLANEKVRWSLRTARLRLARKRKYCQFFTRFGKCNKDDGKCPYIHDPSKIAVCTKFLNGLCTNVDCKLTHKVIPERMEDCSYFLKGSCSKENCPYRHVIVKPASAVCKNFLRGYCADGNECRKKHTYACPAFEATGLCPKASTCKLHHPKKKTEKQQPTNEPKMVRGRYFDGGLVGDDDVSDAAAEAVSTKGKDDLVFDEGNFPEYISLGVGDDEMDQTLASKDEVCDYVSLGEETDDFDDFDVLV